MDADFILIRKMKQGEEQAFDVFVRKYYEEILKYCSYHCSDHEYAKDLTQETFIRFFANLSNHLHKGKTKNFLYTIAGNLCKDFYKKAKAIPMEEMDLREAAGAGKQQTENLINKLTVEWALSQMSDQLREVVILYYFQDLKLTEIAGTLQIGLPLVKYRVKQARIQLEKLIGKEDFYESGRTME